MNRHHLLIWDGWMHCMSGYSFKTEGMISGTVAISTKCEEYRGYACFPGCLFLLLHLLEVRRILMPTSLRLWPACLRAVAVPRQRGCSS